MMNQLVIVSVLIFFNSLLCMGDGKCDGDVMNVVLFGETVEFVPYDFSGLADKELIDMDKVERYKPFCCSEERFLGTVTRINQVDSERNDMRISYEGVKGARELLEGKTEMLFNDDSINKALEYQEYTFTNEQVRSLFQGYLEVLDSKDEELLLLLGQIHEKSIITDINCWYSRCSYNYQVKLEKDSSFSPYSYFDFEEKIIVLKQAILNLDLYKLLLPLYKLFKYVSIVTDSCSDLIDLSKTDNWDNIENYIRQEWAKVANKTKDECDNECQHVIQHFNFELLIDINNLNSKFLKQSLDVIKKQTNERVI